MDCGDKGAESTNVTLAGADSPIFTRDQLVPQAHPGTLQASQLARNVTRTSAKQIVNLCLA